MTRQAEILTRDLGLSADRAEELVRAVRSVASQLAGGRITIRAMIAATHEEPPLLRSVLGTLLLRGVLKARFLPYHRSCDLVIGPDEASEDQIWSNLDAGEYGALCPNCHNYIEGAEDVIIRILFSLPQEER